MAREPDVIPPDQAAMYRRLGEEIAKERERADLSQTELGRLIGKSQRQVSSYETGAGSVTLHVVAAIARALGLNVRTLLTRAKFIEAATTVRGALEDDDIAADAKEVLLDLYDRAVDRALAQAGRRVDEDHDWSMPPRPPGDDLRERIRADDAAELSRRIRAEDEAAPGSGPAASRGRPAAG